MNFVAFRVPAPEPLRFDMILPDGQPLRWDMGPEYVWDGNVPASAYPPTPNPMTTENRISAELTDANLTAILGHLTAARALMPFLVSIPMDERNGIAKFGDKSQAFDEKIAQYESQRPDLVPGFTSVPEATKDRQLIAKMRALNAALSQLADDCQSTELVLGSDIADHDKAFYAAIRLAAQNGVAGAQAIYDDLKQRYPAVSKKPATPKPPTP